MAPVGFSQATRGTDNPFDRVRAGLTGNIYGQDRAVEALMRALNRARLFLRMGDHRRPLSSLLFLGPTGSGKSDVAKRLAGLLHPKGDGFLRIDCSLFSQGHEVASLIGAPPGYVGHDKKPLLNPDVIEKEYSVLLFDEIEKGTKELWNLLLQIMEEGEITLANTGRVVSFRCCIVIMTSNVGARELFQQIEGKRIGYKDVAKAPAPMSGKAIYDLGLKQLQRIFTPEWINRVDEIIAFRPLTSEVIARIFDRMIADKSESYRRLGYRIEVSPEARAFMLAHDGGDLAYGARPVRRRIEKDVDAPLADLISSGGIPEGSEVYIDRIGDEVKLNLTIYHRPCDVLLAELTARRAAALAAQVKADQAKQDAPTGGKVSGPGGPVMTIEKKAADGGPSVAA
jgi:ATP-dependent Clp protease ATP-binding subunit ClpA